MNSRWNGAYLPRASSRITGADSSTCAGTDCPSFGYTVDLSQRFQHVLLVLDHSTPDLKHCMSMYDVLDQAVEHLPLERRYTPPTSQ